LGSADKHLDKVVVQAVIELALKAPFELKIVQIARMKLEIIGMHWNVRVLEFDDDFDAVTLFAGRKVQQRVLVETQLREDAFQANIGGVRHTMILAERFAGI
jgi:hypothetical protein